MNCSHMLHRMVIFSEFGLELPTSLNFDFFLAFHTLSTTNELLRRWTPRNYPRVLNRKPRAVNCQISIWAIFLKLTHPHLEVNPNVIMHCSMEYCNTSNKCIITKINTSKGGKWKCQNPAWDNRLLSDEEIHLCVTQTI